MKPANSILVFDAIAFRRSFLSSHNYYGCTYIDYNILKFLKDINNLCFSGHYYCSFLIRNLNSKIPKTVFAEYLL